MARKRVIIGGRAFLERYATYEGACRMAKKMSSKYSIPLYVSEYQGGWALFSEQVDSFWLDREDLSLEPEDRQKWTETEGD